MPGDIIQPQRKFTRNGWRIIVFSECMLAGAAVAFTLATVLKLGTSNNNLTFPPYLASMLGGGGGLLAGLILSGWYGRPGRSGWIFAVLASLLAPSLAGAIAGSCIAPGPGTIYGAYMPLWTFLYPQPLAVWAICLVVVHMHARRLRAE